MTMSQYLDVPTLDDGHRQQLVHKTPYVQEPSLMVRFAARLGLTKGNQSMMNAVESAYSFVSGNYKPGDQVMFVATSWWEHDLANKVPASLTVYSPAIDSDLDLKAAETLAKHLHDGTRPGDLPESHPSSGNNESPGKIPIYGVVVKTYRETRQMCELNDELKSRFPPGIKHIICWTYFGRERSCATRFDMTGGIVWREMCMSLDSGWNLWFHCTKHVIYWQEYRIPIWDKNHPVWTQVLDSFPGVPDGLVWGLTKPVGIYRHELRKYRCLDLQGKYSFMLVWKSHRGVDESHS
ncbi:unnamed protein product [Rhizoctonia solani]|uniref:Uncharacterized protein n=1 Tax=Rhizoctonia solani TaxID=456999 RepID=A0A8H2WMW8_9AGAM|nr:unnamed protein product [Rhizoctonia solani]